MAYSTFVDETHSGAHAVYQGPCDLTYPHNPLLWEKTKRGGLSNPLYTREEKTDFNLLSLSSSLHPRRNLFGNYGVVIDFILQEEQKELDEITAKRQKKGKNEEEAPAEEKTILHGTVVPL